MADEESTGDFAGAVMAVAELTKPLFEGAAGIRAELEREGRSPAAASAAALEWLNGAQRYFWEIACAQVPAQVAAATQS